MYLLYFALISGLTAASTCAHVTTVMIQAESMFGDVSEVLHRTTASGQKSVHLYEDHRLSTELCLMSDTELVIEEIVYSNDGLADRVQVTVDQHVLEDFQTVVFTDFGKGWSRFRTHKGELPRHFAEGRHILTLKVAESDNYGVEIDYIKIAVNHSQPLDTLFCNAFCFEGITFPFSKPDFHSMGSTTAVQRSVKTKCAEEDNINIPLFHGNSTALNFVVTASSPRYRSFLNNRGPDWTDCKMSEAFWKFKHVPLNHDNQKQEKTSRLNITLMKATSGVGATKPVSVIEVDFDLEGPAVGSIDSEIGTLVHLKNILYKGTLEFQFQYYNRYNSWSKIQTKRVKNEKQVMFETPDFSFKEGKGNRIKIKVYTYQTVSDRISVGELFMTKRWLKPDKSSTLYRDTSTVIEGVDIDMWWRINETMSVTITSENHTFHDIDYIRIYRRVPWTKDGYSQVFVLYQDANIRLLPTTPHGLDWIPFGSSVIIGHTDAMSNRPSAPISHIDINPSLLRVTMFYMDGSVVPLKILTTLSETQLHVSGVQYVRDVNLYPFFTFRSMYVADDNNDVDHVSVDGGIPMKIIGQWQELRGNYFAFYRQCISKHNTQSPDISVQITS